jgi:hypothetical protein
MSATKNFCCKRKSKKNALGRKSQRCTFCKRSPSSNSSRTTRTRKLKKTMNANSCKSERNN